MNFFRSDSQQISFSQCWSFPHLPAYDPAESTNGKASDDAAVNVDEASASAIIDRRAGTRDRDSDRLNP